MLMFDFDKKLYTTTELLAEIGLSLGWLDLHKSKWRKKGNDCWDMGVRLVGNKALWDPIVFLDWISKHKLKNLPKDLRKPNIVAVVSRNSSEKKG